jgi:hypothetical protein
MKRKCEPTDMGFRYVSDRQFEGTQPQTKYRVQEMWLGKANVPTHVSMTSMYKQKQFRSTKPLVTLLILFP